MSSRVKEVICTDETIRNPAPLRCVLASFGAFFYSTFTV